VNHTGVAGLTLGGGFGYLSAKYGLTIDNLLKVKVVLADGEITNASQTENEDLFWAIRGSGSNFGVVTSLTFQSHPKPPVVYTANLVFAPPQLPQLVEVINKLYSDGLIEDMSTILGFVHGPAGPALTAILVYFGTEIQAKEYYSGFYKIGPLMEQGAEVPYEQVNTILNPLVEYGKLRAMGASSFKLPLDQDFIQSTYGDYIKFAQDTSLVETAILFEVFPNDKIKAIPLDSMAFANRGDFFNIALLSTWYDEAQGDTVWNFMESMGRQIRANSGVSYDKGVGIYPNYIGGKLNRLGRR
jgi:hypothetical protein